MLLSKEIVILVSLFTKFYFIFGFIFVYFYSRENYVRVYILWLEGIQNYMAQRGLYQQQNKL